MAHKIVLDAGHGGSDKGAAYGERSEKDDALKLSLAVGARLTENGVDVEYTRMTDVYNTPYEKAVMANNAGADLFVSIHRNSSKSPDCEGAEALVFQNTGIRSVLAANINKKLESVEFENLGITERPNLVILKRTEMPAVLVEVGFIDSDKDNELFDSKFDEITAAIADGILATVELNQQQTERFLYRVQVGAYRNKNSAYKLMEQLQREGYQGFIILNNDIYKVQVGAFEVLENAVRMERSLRSAGYGTYIVTQ